MWSCSERAVLYSLHEAFDNQRRAAEAAAADAEDIKELELLEKRLENTNFA